ncbi:MAG: TetR/AcrR family transcriptional regulator [Cyclobacteriaceae bacterium]
MRNPEITKERILKQSGHLFNTQGYKATSISDITKATGLTKGAIYRHFESKAVLEMETLSHLSAQMFSYLRVKIKEERTAPEKLRAIFNFFETYVSKPPVKGGCPLLNVAIEVDDAHPALRKRAVLMLDMFKDAIITILNNGVKYNQLKADIDKEYYATVIIAGLEGAIMMSKLRGNDDDIVRVAKHLTQMLNEIEL